MLGDLVIEGSVKPIGDTPFAATFWPDMTLRVLHSATRDPIGRVWGLTSQPDGGVGMKSDIALGVYSLTALNVCRGLSAGAVKRDDKAEIIEFSVIDYPANMPNEQRNLWRVAKGRLPRVLLSWIDVRRWPGGEQIELFEVGWNIHGDLAEVEPAYAISDHVARLELMGIRRG